jgi:tRNA A64-2'-O-ribosylphosphate transferase
MTSPLPSELKASLNQHKSISKVLRSLKRQEVGLYNCICSVLADTAFVKEIASLHPNLPLIANLRCGLWYAPHSAGTCYFKSTDGHYGNWAFSLTRLNLRAALLAARSGGCLIVDATRRGKTFPVRHSLHFVTRKQSTE